jgi:hypothetical protein
MSQAGRFHRGTGLAVLVGTYGVPSVVRQPCDAVRKLAIKQPHHRAVYPPSITSSVPVTNLASSLAR